MNRNILLSVALICICSLPELLAQTNFKLYKDSDASIYYYVRARANVATGGQTPFWMTSGTYGVVPLTGSSAYLQTQAKFISVGDKFVYQAGIDMITTTTRYRNVYVQELYGLITYNTWLSLLIGSAEHASSNSIVNNKLSSGDMAISTNARPIPEINLMVNDFTYIPLTNKRLQFRGNFSVGRSFDDAYLQSYVKTPQTYNRNVLWHNKSLHLRLNVRSRYESLAGIIGFRHVAQWGGTSTDPALGAQPHSFKDFLRVVTGKAGDASATESDQVNVLGNHYGTYDFGLEYSYYGRKVKLYHQHFFDDRSGMEFENGMDGLYGVELSLKSDNWLTGLVVERLYTLNQSGPFHFIWFDHAKYPGTGGGGDNYYNNGEYTTGASYFNRSTGSPLLISPEYNDGQLGFRHNRIAAWHLGAEGNIINYIMTYKVKCSYITSYGTPTEPLLKKTGSLAAAAEVTYINDKRVFFTLSIAADRGALLGNHAGISISVYKRL
ncbi:MAG: capsule assembly Wzi family protein [Tannerella sp.]|jgi:hypothetical protein|nr:capsule assembly Wzi family protein [Tannerella sp.]